MCQDTQVQEQDRDFGEAEAETVTQRGKPAKLHIISPVSYHDILSTQRPGGAHH